MGLGFKRARKHGVHFDRARIAAEQLKTANLLLKGSSERLFEHTLVACLESRPELAGHLLTQIGDDATVKRITRAELFGFRHKPDTAIAENGTAVAIKLVKRGHAIRDLLGQALTYRMLYRFVILVLIDHTSGKQIVELCSRPGPERDLLWGLSEDFNTFTVVGPLGAGKNLLFAPWCSRGHEEVRAA